MSESQDTAPVEVEPNPAPPPTEQDMINELDTLLEGEGVIKDVQYDYRGNPLPIQAKPEAVEPEKPVEAQEQESVEAQPETAEGETAPVDYDQLIPMDNVLGEDQPPITISALKDEITESRRMAAKVERMETELMQERQILNEVLAHDGQLTDEQKGRVEELRKQVFDRQTQTVFQQFPEWRDPLVFQKVQPELQRVAKSAGFSNAEIQQMTHPAMFNLIERVRRYEAREQKGQQAVKAATQTPPKTRGRTPAARTNGKRQTLDSILSKDYKSEADVPWNEIDRLLGN